MFRTFFHIASASLMRRKSRTMMVIIMIAVCFWGMLTMEGIYDGMTEQVINNAIRSSSGHISIFAKGYRQEKGLTNRMDNVDIILQVLKNDDNIRSYTSRVIQDSLIATAHYSQNGTLIGLNLSQESKHGRLDEFLIKGVYSFGEKNKGIILGSKLAEKLKADIGRKIILSAQDTNSEIAAQAFKVTGILRTNNMSVDERSVFVDISAARKMLALGEGATQVSIMLKTQSSLDAAITKLRNRFAHLEILDWGELYPALLQSRTMMKLFNLITSLIVFFVAGLGIFGVMLVSVLERLREFGIMMAVGTRFSQITVIVMSESLTMSLLGFLAGSILGASTLFYFITNGLDLTLFSEGLDAFGLNTIIYAIIRPEYFTTAFAAIFLAAVTSVLYPLWVLKRSKPIETINKV